MVLCGKNTLPEIVCMRVYVFLQGSLADWLSLIGLHQYYQALGQNGYENMDVVSELSWDDLQEIGITKLGNYDNR